MRHRSREEDAGAVHHVVAKGNGGGRIVLDDVDRAAYCARYAFVVREYGWIVHTECLMDTHHHAVVETPEPNLGRGMQRMLGGYAHRFNKRHGRDGHLFHGPFWSRRIADEAHFFSACLYAVLNPVAAGLCTHPKDWPWSSYRAIAAGKGSWMLMEMFGDNPEDAARCYVAVVDDLTAQIDERRAEDGRSLWSLTGSVLPGEQQGAG